ncbi:hypothetical protein SNEBB_000570 [Seison nebaliae]|nr:hypothetical protein SNEBB_000570 [Seison nebaliae]
MASASNRIKILPREIVLWLRHNNVPLTINKNDMANGIYFQTILKQAHPKASKLLDLKPFYKYDDRRRNWLSLDKEFSELKMVVPAEIIKAIMLFNHEACLILICYIYENITSIKIGADNYAKHFFWKPSFGGKIALMNDTLTKHHSHSFNSLPQNRTERSKVEISKHAGSKSQQFPKKRLSSSTGARSQSNDRRRSGRSVRSTGVSSLDKSQISTMATDLVPKSDHSASSLVPEDSEKQEKRSQMNPLLRKTFREIVPNRLESSAKKKHQCLNTVLIKVRQSFKGEEKEIVDDAVVDTNDEIVYQLD